MSLKFVFVVSQMNPVHTLSFHAVSLILIFLRLSLKETFCVVECYGEKPLAPRRSPNLEDCPLLAIHRYHTYLEFISSGHIMRMCSAEVTKDTLNTDLLKDTVNRSAYIVPNNRTRRE